MKREITLKMDLSDWELALIVPSSTVKAVIYNSKHQGIDKESEIVSVKDVHNVETPQTVAVMPGLTTELMAECEFIVRVDMYEGAVFTNYESARRYARGARFAMDAILPHDRYIKVTVTAIDGNGVAICTEDIF